jgi:hypothetical protein
MYGLSKQNKSRLLTIVTLCCVILTASFFLDGTAARLKDVIRTPGLTIAMKTITTVGKLGVLVAIVACLYATGPRFCQRLSTTYCDPCWASTVDDRTLRVGAEAVDSAWKRRRILFFLGVVSERYDVSFGSCRDGLCSSQLFSATCTGHFDGRCLLLL